MKTNAHKKEFCGYGTDFCGYGAAIDAAIEMPISAIAARHPL
jgi:hypothetical protein